MLNVATIIAAINAGIALIPEGLTLIDEGKELLSAEDKASVLARLDAEADTMHAAGLASNYLEPGTAAL